MMSQYPVGGEPEQRFERNMAIYPDSSKTREKFLVFFGLADFAWCIERTDPFRSAVPIDPDQLFRLIPITDSGRSRSVCGEV
jgi:hypothetical protein